MVSLFEDRAGALWVGSIDGLSRLRFDAAGRRSEIRAFHKAEGLVTERTYDDRKRTPPGASSSPTARVSPISTASASGRSGRDSGLDTASVRSLGRTANGTLWAGGYARLARLVVRARRRGAAFRLLGEASGLADVLVLTIADDRQGRLLLGTNRGVLVFDPAARGGLGAVLARFDRASGAIASEVSHSSAFARDESGRSWFGFKGGVTAFPADLDPPRAPAPPPVIIERLATRGGFELRAPFSGRGRGDEPQLGKAPIVLPQCGLELARRSARVDAPRRKRRCATSSSSSASMATGRSRSPRRFATTPTSIRGRIACRPAPRSATAPGARRWSSISRCRRPGTSGAWSGRSPAWGCSQRSSPPPPTAHGACGHTNRALERDVTERTDDLARYARALEEHAHALDRANERIRLADRHRSEFLAKMSHELRTPLTSVLGFAALLADGLGSALEPRHARYLENIRESGNQLLRLINNLLDQAKIEAGRMDLQLEPASLEAIAESALSMMEGYGATRGVHLKASFEREVPAIVVDVAKLRQAILNLLSNAIKFSGRGSEVELRTRFLPAAESVLEDDSYEIVVADQGPGIEPADQERIFEPFRQLAARGETVAGTGLGLAIARQFIALLGGALEVESAAGEGAAFRILLPVDATTRAAGRPGTGAPARSRRGRSAAGGRSRAGPRAIHRGRRGPRTPGFPRGAGARQRRGPPHAARTAAGGGGRRHRPRASGGLDDAARPRARSRAGGDTARPVRFRRRQRARRGGELRMRAARTGFGRRARGGAPAHVGGKTSTCRAARSLTPGRRAVWLAAGPRNAPPELDPELGTAGFTAQRPVTQSRAQAQAAGGEFSAIVVDLSDRATGGFEMAVELQGGRASDCAWIALAPAELTSSERKRLVEYVEGAAASGGAAVAAAALRVTRGVPAADHGGRADPTIEPEIERRWKAPMEQRS